jgi:hypothetical protein
MGIPRRRFMGAEPQERRLYRLHQADPNQGLALQLSRCSVFVGACGPRQESIVKEPTKTIRLCGCAAATVVELCLLVAGCGGPDGAGTLNMSAVKAVAASRGLPDGSKGLPAPVSKSKARRGKALVAPIKPVRGGH